MLNSQPQERKPISSAAVYFKMFFTFPIFYPVILMYWLAAHMYDASGNKEKSKEQFDLLEFWSNTGIITSFVLALLLMFLRVFL